MIFSYNALVFSDASTASIATHAKSLLNRLVNKRLAKQECHRPIVFVSHSVGGLVVKHALVESILAVEGEYRCITASTYGLVFFATPHRGANKAESADFVANVCSSLTGNSKNSLLKQLQRKSVLNEMLNDQFSQ